MPKITWNAVEKFEKALAEFAGAPYAVATDCCTHAVELGLRYEQPQVVRMTKHTYLSIPMTVKHLGISLELIDEQWEDYYHLHESTVIDAAPLWEPNMYVAGSLFCLSFQHKKPLSLGRAGAILTDNHQAYEWLKRAVYDGRTPGTPWKNDTVPFMGWHYYMTPEDANKGLKKMKTAEMVDRPLWRNYPSVTQFGLFG